jgi:hypothetical protein
MQSIASTPIARAARTRFEIVVSTENNPYMVWQAMLFHSSCVRHLGQAPIVMVHTDGLPLLSGFERIRATGGRIETAPDYRQLHGVNYPPRNTAATLRHVQTDADYIVLCDPDMVFLQPLPWQELSLGSSQISFDFVGYLDANGEVYQPAVDNVCRQAGVDPQRLRNPQYNGGVPHVIPIQHQQALSSLWLELMELFPEVPPCSPEIPGARPRGCHEGPQKDWLCTMWALLIAAERLNLEPHLTHFCLTTQNGDQPLPTVEPGGPCLIHYCYEEAGFRKHQYDTLEAAEQTVWRVPEDDGTVSGNIRSQLRYACDFYGLL